MLIGVDGNEANVESRVGVGEYAFELLLQFEKYQISRPKADQPLAEKFKVYLKDNPREDLPKASDSWEYRVIGPKPLWTQVALPFDLYAHLPQPDVFFTPTHYAPRFSPVPTVITILDLSYIYFPQMFKKGDLYKLKSWSEYSVANAAKVLTISKASKDDIIKTYGVPGERVVVTYPGIKVKTPAFVSAASFAGLATKAESAGEQNSMKNGTLLSEKFGISGDYILFVGTLQPRKNIVRLIEAFSKIVKNYSSSEEPLATSREVNSSRLRSNNKTLQLVIVGKKGWQYEEIFSAPKKYGVEEEVKFLDFVSDEDLEVLYQHAHCFVLPSLYEGFGLPVLEAMQYGCPVVTSSISSLPEAGGDAALYVDPKSVDDIARKIVSVLEDDKLRKTMIEKGKKHAAGFSWEKTAKETLAVLEEVAGKNER